MDKTALMYMDDSYQYVAQAVVKDIKPTAEGKCLVILDQTIFYPRGGGQECDLGTISNPSGKLIVEDVWMGEGLVQHNGLLRGTLAIGDQVNLEIDQQRRIRNSKLHTAGHLLDDVIYGANYPWQGLGAGQSGDIAWVDYTGTFERDAGYKEQLETGLNNLIKAALPVTIGYYKHDELERVCYFLAHRMPDVKTYRVVFSGAKQGNLCGGTHVHNTSEVGPVKIRKVKCKKGKIIVSFQLENV